MVNVCTKRCAFTMLVVIQGFVGYAIGETVAFDVIVSGNITADCGSCINVGDIGRVTIDFDSDPSIAPVFDEFNQGTFDTGINSITISIGDCYENTLFTNGLDAALTDFYPGAPASSLITDEWSVISRDLGLLGETSIGSLQQPWQLSTLTSIAEDPNMLFGGFVSNDCVEFDFISVPEPSGSLLLMCGVVSCLGLHRRRAGSFARSYRKAGR